jgi:outer membrane murein-binding lipoprotein Lpp
MKYSLLVVALLVTGCATNSDVAKIQTQIDDLKPQIASIAKDSADAKASALKAFESAEKATQLQEQISAKLNKIFKKAQQK